MQAAGTSSSAIPNGGNFLPETDSGVAQKARPPWSRPDPYRLRWRIVGGQGGRAHGSRSFQNLSLGQFIDRATNSPYSVGIRACLGHWHGKVATPEIAAAAHRFLRRWRGRSVFWEHASAVRILYGGSVKPENIQGLLAPEELDGALVGGRVLSRKVSRRS